MKTTARDKVGGCSIGALTVPKLKGHVKLTLHNCSNGKTETIEGSNIVTDALDDLLACNYLSAINMNTGSFLPLADNWFGGVLAFRNAFSTVTIDGNVVPDPAAYYPEGDDVNECIAHAGDTAPGTAILVAEDYKRGSPVAVTKTGNSVKFTWEWLPSQGCGIINSVALTHKDVGNAGLGSTSTAFKAFNPYTSIGNLPSVTTSLAGIQSLFAQYDVNHGLYFHIGADADWYADHTTFGTTTLTVKIRRLPFNKVGLHETMSVISTGERSFEITTSFTMYLQPAYYFDYTNKRLWIFSNITKVAPSYGDSNFGYSNNSCNYAVIDCENENVLSEGTISISDTDLAPTAMQSWSNSSYPATISKWINANFIVENGYVYFPRTSGIYAGNRSNMSAFNINGYKKINLSDNTDVEDIDFNITQEQLRPVKKCGGLIISDGVIMNNGTGFQCATMLPYADGLNNNYYSTFALSEPEKACTIATATGNGYQSGTTSRYLLASKLLLTTKYNLPSQVEKTGVQAMTVEYTLTEQ